MGGTKRGGEAGERPVSGPQARTSESTGAATADELDWLLSLAADEGWNPGLDDASAFRAADPDGFLVARVDGRAVAGISVVRQDEASGFLGLYLCAPAWRGRGHGRRVWDAGLERLDGLRVGLDGVPAQQANYRREGFRPAWCNVRFAGSIPAADVGTGHASDTIRKAAGRLDRSPEAGPGAAVDARPDRASDAVADGTPCAVAPADHAALIALDREVGGVDRTQFLRAWFAPCATRHSLRCVGTDGRPVAFGTIRRCRDGFKVGPLIADSPALARRLLLALAREADGEPVVLDVPDVNAPGIELATGLGLAPVFETARMYRGDPPPVDASRLFGVATLELG